MPTILLVDDEWIERDGLRFLLERRGDVLEVLEAANGAEALKIIREKTVDIMITDIRMPFMDGLELTRQAREEKSDAEILIYSAYSDFEYAQKAIKYGVSAYILKPIMPGQFYEELDGALCRRKQTLEANRLREGFLDYRRLDRLEREKCWHDLIHGRPMEAELEQRMRDKGIVLHMMHPYLVMVSFHGGFFSKNIERFEQEISVRADGSWLLDSDKLLLLFADMERLSDETLYAAAQTLQGDIAARFHQTPSLLVTRSEKSTGQEEKDTFCAALNRSFRALDGQSSGRLLRPGSIRLLNDQSRLTDADLYKQLDMIRTQIHQALENNRLEEARGELEALIQMIGSMADLSALYTKYAVADIVQDIHRHQGAQPIERKSSFDQIWASKDVGELVNRLAQCLETLSGDPLDAAGKARVVDRLIELVETRCGEDLTLEAAAKSVYLTPSYVSYLFKHHTGQTFIRYLTRCRMERAAHLLRSSDKQITRIMAEVGYNNSSYFSSVFRAEYGETPSQYRRRYGGDKR